MFKAKAVHFIGIGGIGISALAKMLLGLKVHVSGSDVSSSPVVDELKKLGASVSLGHSAKNIPTKCELVVYTNAVSKDNVELVRAKNMGIKTLSYPEALGEISKGRFVIAISGNAGKTTTTAMVGQILIDAGFEPTVIVGSLANFTDRKGNTLTTNFVSGSGKYFVVEADEYKRAFLNLEPKILAITNIEEDHLDYYKNLSDIQDAFIELAEKVPKDGFIISSLKDRNILPILERSSATMLDYNDVSIKDFPLSIPGKHNRDNAKVAVAVARTLGIKEGIIKNSLFQFKNPWRRFEYSGETKNGALVYDDYAHNPQKIRAVIAGAKEKFPDKKIVVIFQPHLFSRTRQLLSELAKSFAGAHRVIITPIYAAREFVDPDINHHLLAKAIEATRTVDKVETVDSLEEIPLQLKIEGGDALILTVGAGDIYTINSFILDKV